MFNEVRGDLFSSGADVLAHGCNTFGVMGRGIAVPFKRKWPEMFAEYRAHCHSNEHDDLHATSLLWKNPDGPDIACLFTQWDYIAEPVFIEEALLELVEQMGGKGSVAFPAIGCGVAKTTQMSIEVLRDICHRIFDDSDIEATLYLGGV